MADDNTPKTPEETSAKPKINPTARKGLNLAKPGDDDAPASAAPATSTPPAEPAEAGAPKPVAKKPVALSKPRPVSPSPASKPKAIKPVDEKSSSEEVTVPMLVVDILAAAACLTFAVLLYLEFSGTQLDASQEVRAPAAQFDLTNPGDR